MEALWEGYFSVYSKKIILKKIKILKTNQQKTILDVRSEEEFATGHIEGSINIPLHEIPDRLTEIKKIDKPLILCCASGNRSRQATTYLKSVGIECNNGGSWLDINLN